MSKLIRTFLIVIAPLALLGLGAQVHAQASDVDCNGCVDIGDIASGAISASRIRAGAVTSSKMRTEAVTTGKIADRAVTGQKIKKDAVTTSKIRNGAVTLEKLAADVLAPPHVLTCGSFQRNVSSFVPGYPAIAVIEGCSPSANTISMAVRRNNAFNVDAVELQNFLNGGGSVVCEFNSCQVIFNMAFGEAAANGSQTGSCGDAVQPELKTISNFWDNVDFVASGNGCGYDLQTWPSVIPLGGWAIPANSVSLGYRNLGDGRLWLAPTDWQDTANQEFRHSRAILGYMLTHVR